MKSILAACFVLSAFSAFSQHGLPAWLEPDSTGKDIYVQGVIALMADSAQTSGDVVIIDEGTTDRSYTLKTTMDGFYEFFLKADTRYTIIYKKPGYLDKRVEIHTGGIPEKGWRRGFAVVVDIFMEKTPPGFDVTISQTPVGICRYDVKSKNMEFDREYSKARRAEWDAEIARVSQ